VLAEGTLSPQKGDAGVGSAGAGARGALGSDSLPSSRAVAVTAADARPLGRRPWFIATMTSLGVVAAGAVVVGVALGTGPAGPQLLSEVDAR
jgi:hypothetical protein